MIDFLKILKSTTAYRILTNDKLENKLSHAYLFLCADNQFLGEYLKIVSKIIACGDGYPCLSCRNCQLIEKNAHSDVLWYPKGDKGIVTEDVTNIIEESYVKPIENDKKLFVLQNAETMNLSAQNKLLKTLEEPPKNIHIVLGANSDFALLPTIKSRVKTIEIFALNDGIIFDALKDDCPNHEKLRQAISCGDGTVGKALSLYKDEKFESLLEFVEDLLINMKTSREVLYYSTKVDSLKINISELFGVLELVFNDFLYILENKRQYVKNTVSLSIFDGVKDFKRGAVLNALEKLNEAQRRLKFNANEKMLLEWVLFQVLEGKYKWQKLLG